MWPLNLERTNDSKGRRFTWKTACPKSPPKKAGGRWSFPADGVNPPPGSVSISGGAVVTACQTRYLESPKPYAKFLCQTLVPNFWILNILETLFPLIVPPGRPRIPQVTPKPITPISAKSCGRRPSTQAALGRQQYFPPGVRRHFKRLRSARFLKPKKASRR